MKRDVRTRALGSLLEVRHLAVVDARVALAAALAAEAAAAAVAAAATHSIREEIEAAAAETADDAAVEALASWLPQARERQTGAVRSRHAAEVTTATARAALGTARAAEAAVEGLVEAAAAEQRTDTERQAQADLNEQVLLATVQGGAALR